ncbi:hypothetical protein EVAR_81405_1 [Eumeta japonica]|uniref:Uncharacterized protein n=1 Tax=Eumeta variegata TaxID=151549 RepID=A0A4C1WI46_EUMVA|nr:hypothetical protein EVAR_81405_1 [Eumeta japonica]
MHDAARSRETGVAVQPDTPSVELQSIGADEEEEEKHLNRLLDMRSGSRLQNPLIDKNCCNNNEDEADEKRSGRHLTADTEENVLAVEKLVQENRRTSYEEIQRILQTGSGNVHEVIHGHLRVGRHESTHSTRRQNRAGVPQGSTLLPLLYSEYTNDIPRPSSGVQLTLFADDTALYIAARRFPRKPKLIQSAYLKKARITPFFTTTNHQIKRNQQLYQSSMPVERRNKSISEPLKSTIFGL